MPKSFGRHSQGCAFAILNIFLAIQVTLGIVTIAANEYFKHTISKHVGKGEAEQIKTQLFFMEIYGMHLIVFYGCGFLISKKFQNEPYTTHLLTLLKVWHIFILVISVDGTITTWMLFRSLDTMLDSIELSLLRGIEVYYSNPEWRIIWDDMQYHQQCCGVRNYQDWQNTAWIEYEYDDNTALAEADPSDTKLLSLTPYSCCKKDVGCFENYLPQRSGENTFLDLPTLNLTGINQCGCLPVIDDEYHFALYTELVIVILVFTFQILILLLMRLIFLRSDYCFPLQKVNSECQTTFIVTCPKKDIEHCENCTGAVICLDEDEEPCSQKKCNCKNKKKVGFCCDEECAPLLIH